VNIKCIVKDCQNHKHEGGFTGDLCNPCYRFITTNEANNSQAYRNVELRVGQQEKVIKALTDLAVEQDKKIVDLAFRAVYAERSAQIAYDPKKHGVEQ